MQCEHTAHNSGKTTLHLCQFARSELWSWSRIIGQQEVYVKCMDVLLYYLQQIERVNLLPRSKQKFIIEMIDTVIQQQSAS